MSLDKKWADNPRLQAAITHLQDVMDAEMMAGNLIVSYWALFVDSPEGVYETSAGCDNPMHKLHVSQAAGATVMAALVADATSGLPENDSNRGHVH